MSAALVSRMTNIDESILDGLHSPFASIGTTHHQDKTADETLPRLPYLPNEIVGQVALRLEDAVDVTNFRLTNLRFSECGKLALFEIIGDNRVIYPRYDTMMSFLSLAATTPVLANHVRKVVLVGETFKLHEFGYDWAWEDLMIWEDVEVTRGDLDTIYRLNTEHASALAISNAFVHTGAYRKLLTYLLARLPKLEVIQIRKLKVGENLPGWNGNELIKNLSFYHDNLDTNKIFYGDWQYDIEHKRVTVYKDEFGDDAVEPQAGTQAFFLDDVRAALEATTGMVKVEFD